MRASFSRCQIWVVMRNWLHYYFVRDSAVEVLCKKTVKIQTLSYTKWKRKACTIFLSRIHTTEHKAASTVYKLSGHFLAWLVCCLKAACLRHSAGREPATEQFCAVLGLANYMHKSRTVMHCEVLTAVITMMTGFWDMTPCTFVEMYVSAVIFGIALHELYEVNVRW